jgi:hypothetical protein
MEIGGNMIFAKCCTDWVLLLLFAYSTCKPCDFSSSSLNKYSLLHPVFQYSSY